MPDSCRRRRRTLLDNRERLLPFPDDTLALLRDAIHLSGSSTRSFAETVLVREERTVRRWMAGDTPIPEVVARRLRRYLVEHSSEHRPTQR
jgi:hypothetical protein